ncbi:MAG: phytanoyl-CoA dioxygenase family protein [Gammaproteobacteria bacterium]
MSQTSAKQNLSETDIKRFQRDGFVIVPGLADRTMCKRMADVVHTSLSPPLAPLEFESDVPYPGAPADRLAPGGDTPRRLLHAYARDVLFRDWATSARVARKLQQLLQTSKIMASQNHHNCIMTKHPGYSSATLWHQDIRYWTFDRPELISVWLALGEENAANGGLQILPGTHALELDRGRFDAALFLRPDQPENQQLIDTAVDARLEPGDALFFHCRAFHAAGRNTTDKVKLSVVFTYFAADNRPIAGTRSARYPDIAIG